MTRPRASWDSSEVVFNLIPSMVFVQTVLRDMPQHNKSSKQRFDVGVMLRPILLLASHPSHPLTGLPRAWPQHQCPASWAHPWTTLPGELSRPRWLTLPSRRQPIPSRNRDWRPASPQFSLTPSSVYTSGMPPHHLHQQKHLEWRTTRKAVLHGASKPFVRSSSLVSKSCSLFFKCHGAWITGLLTHQV